MKQAIGVILIVVGVMLLVWGHNMAQSIGSQVKQVFTGAPEDRATYFYISGVILLLVGIFQVFMPRRSK
jgi:uncharacterized membrane protein